MAVDAALLAAGLLLSAMLAFHSVAGERYIVRRLLRRDNLPKLFGNDTFTKRTIRYAWHLLTIVGGALCAILFYGAVVPLPPALLHIVGVTLSASALWGLWSTRARHLSWILLLVVAGLVEFSAVQG